MSSTNRSDARKSHIADYYVTPILPISTFFDELLKCETFDKEIKILDPCAGGDIKHEMSYPKALHEKGFNNVDKRVLGKEYVQLLFCT